MAETIAVVVGLIGAGYILFKIIQAIAAMISAAEGADDADGDKS
jgi:hypothetical protein